MHGRGSFVPLWKYYYIWKWKTNTKKTHNTEIMTTRNYTNIKHISAFILGIIIIIIHTHLVLCSTLLGRHDIKMTVFWDVAPCSLVEVCRRFRGSCSLHRPDNGGTTHIWNDGKLLPDYTPQHYRRQVNFILAAVRTWNLTDMLSASENTKKQ
jgi:hypothetical protein